MVEQNIVSEMAEQGWEVVETQGRYATLRRPKKWNWTAFLFLSLFFNIFGFIGYIMYYSGRNPWDTKIVDKKND